MDGRRKLGICFLTLSDNTLKGPHQEGEKGVGLLKDLEVKGLLDSTLVVLGTEFGRSPKINSNAGRNRYPKAFSTLMAGGGIKGGQVYGSTDKTASTVIKDKVSAPDFNATIGHALGIEHDKVIYSPSKRPFRMGAREGKPITKLFT